VGCMFRGPIWTGGKATADLVEEGRNGRNGRLCWEHVGWTNAERCPE
jgi:hypothetical protein